MMTVIPPAIATASSTTSQSTTMAPTTKALTTDITTLSTTSLDTTKPDKTTKQHSTTENIMMTFPSTTEHISTEVTAKSKTTAPVTTSQKTAETTTTSTAGITTREDPTTKEPITAAKTTEAAAEVPSTEVDATTVIPTTDATHVTSGVTTILPTTEVTTPKATSQTTTAPATKGATISTTDVTTVPTTEMDTTVEPTTLKTTTETTSAPTTTIGTTDVTTEPTMITTDVTTDMDTTAKPTTPGTSTESTSVPMTTIRTTDVTTEPTTQTDTTVESTTPTTELTLSTTAQTTTAAKLSTPAPGTESIVTTMLPSTEMPTTEMDTTVEPTTLKTTTETTSAPTTTIRTTDVTTERTTEMDTTMKPTTLKTKTETTSAPTTTIGTTDVTTEPTTEMDTTMKPTTLKTKIETTSAPTTTIGTTDVTTEPTTEMDTTMKPTTLKTKTETTSAPTTTIGTTDVTTQPTIEIDTTMKPTTLKTTTETTSAPTTTIRTTDETTQPTTEMDTTMKPTTPRITTQTTSAPTTTIRTTVEPTTEIDTTMKPTTLKTTTETTSAPTTTIGTTDVTTQPTTEIDTTMKPTTLKTTTETTSAPTTTIRTTVEPTTEIDTTMKPTTPRITTQTTSAPTTTIRTTVEPTTPSTSAPMTEIMTELPTTILETTLLPTTELPTTELPTTEATTRITTVPTTQEKTLATTAATTPRPTTHITTVPTTKDTTVVTTASTTTPGATTRATTALTTKKETTVAATTSQVTTQATTISTTVKATTPQITTQTTSAPTTTEKYTTVVTTAATTPGVTTQTTVPTTARITTATTLPITTQVITSAPTTTQKDTTLLTTAVTTPRMTTQTTPQITTQMTTSPTTEKTTSTTTVTTQQITTQKTSAPTTKKDTTVVTTAVTTPGMTTLTTTVPTTPPITTQMSSSARTITRRDTTVLTTSVTTPPITTQMTTSPTTMKTTAATTTKVTTSQITTQTSTTQPTKTPRTTTVMTTPPAVCNSGCDEHADGLSNGTCQCRKGFSGNGTTCELVSSGFSQSVRFTGLAYRATLADCTSDDYVATKAQLETTVTEIYSDTSIAAQLYSVTVTDFSSGSLIVQMTVTTDPAAGITYDVLEAAFISSVGINLDVNTTEICYSSHCSNGGSCQVGNVSRSCECSMYYTGEKCETQVLDGQYGEWSSWSNCLSTCGQGSQIRTRQCDSPPPSGNGRYCNGSSVEFRACDLPDCPKGHIDWCTAEEDRCSQTSGAGNCFLVAPDYDCYCDHGYQMILSNNDTEFVRCQDMDECALGWDHCEPDFATCTNTIGGYTCTCKAGYKGDGFQCQDIDECQEQSNTTRCDPHASCVNTEGSYNCTCNLGYHSTSQQGTGFVGQCRENRLFPFGEETNDKLLDIPPGNGEVISSPIKVPYGLPVPGGLCNDLCVTENGLIVATNGENYYGIPGLRNPGPLSQVLGKETDLCAIFSPFWANNRFTQLLPGMAPKVWFNTYTADEPVTGLVNSAIRRTKPSSGNFTAAFVFIATWQRMVPPWLADSTEENTFQAVVATDYYHTYVMYRYRDRYMTWVPVLPLLVYYLDGYPARIGYAVRTASSTYSIEDPNSAWWSRSNNDINAYRVSQKVSQTTGKQGQIFYQVDNNGDDYINARLACDNWARDEPDVSNYAANLIGTCPRYFRQARAESGRWILTSANCFSKAFTLSTGGNYECCYNNVGALIDSVSRFGSGAGFLHRYRKDMNTNSTYYKNDYLPRIWCCEMSGDDNFCSKFRRKRPIASSRNYRHTVQASGLGDPHITTLDGATFSFNGHGEFLLLRNTSDSPHSFELQARTKRPVINGVEVRGTVYSGIAFKQPSEAVEVHLSSGSPGFYVVINGVELQKEEVIAGKTFSDGRVFAQNDNAGNLTGILVSFPSGISISVTRGLNLLSYVVGMPGEMSGKLQGILGNLNGNASDDFILPNGSPYPTSNPSKLQDSAIFPFGQAWSLRNVSSLQGVDVSTVTLFTRYPSGSSAASYGDDSFRPKFFTSDLDVLFDGNTTFKNQAIAACGGENNTQCLHDIAVTGLIEVGLATTQGLLAFQQATAVLANNPPNMTAPSEVRVKVGETFTVTLRATDEQPVVNFTLSGSGTLTQSAGLEANFVWTPTSTNKTTISWTATDILNAATTVFPDITVCGCVNLGTCNYDNVGVRTEGFGVATCVCPNGWGGQFCEQDIDGCSGNPCFQGVTCKDQPAPLMANQTGYECGPCPGSMIGNGEQCEDLNECLLDKNDSRACQCVNADCINTAGSYSCNCFQGYHKDGDSFVCVDINECRQPTQNDCDDNHGYCNNTDGGYVCGCRPGYELQSDGKTCSDINECLVNNGGCDRLCVNTDGEHECECGAAYYLHSDGRTCLELDECMAGSRCEHVCVDHVGYYECQCHPHFNLDVNARTCTPFYNCSVNNSCHPQPIGGCAANSTGAEFCVCDFGYELQANNSCQDIDECARGTDICDENARECRNTPGSYECICKDGFRQSTERGGRKCDNIDECSVNNGNCSQKCEDTQGSFYCRCQMGYYLDTDGRTCININECAANTTNDCSTNAVCRDEDGGFYCNCRQGYEGDGSLCGDVNECLQTGDVGQGGCKVGCRNFLGGYECICAPGFVLANDSVSCIAKNSCDSSPCDHFCTNLVDSYNCSCRENYKLHSDGRTCVEIECHKGCHEHAEYVFNGTDSFCRCKTGWSGDGSTLCEIDSAGFGLELSFGDLVFTSDLTDCRTDVHKNIRKQIELALTMFFETHFNQTIRSAFQSVSTSEFRSGSVVASTLLTTDPSAALTNADITKAFVNGARNTSIDLMGLNVSDITYQAFCYKGYCQNGGSCSIQNKAKTCSCPLQYTGARCQINIVSVVSGTTAGFFAVFLVLGIFIIVLRNQTLEEKAKKYKPTFAKPSHRWLADPSAMDKADSRENLYDIQVTRFLPGVRKRHKSATHSFGASSIAGAIKDKEIYEEIFMSSMRYRLPRPVIDPRALQALMDMITPSIDGRHSVSARSVMSIDIGDRFSMGRTESAAGDDARSMVFGPEMHEESFHMDFTSAVNTSEDDDRSHLSFSFGHESTTERYTDDDDVFDDKASQRSETGSEISSQSTDTKHSETTSYTSETTESSWSGATVINSAAVPIPPQSRPLTTPTIMGSLVNRYAKDWQSGYKKF
ncbi:MUC4 [Branchiostoma lanceolatum]|uniref:MUC4 protein n=1 Tax=Branchiostoma lanceolatum TaxID=7740 RepID=A0A8J9VSY1_BRALA|nr:MUC4 [Branchiostoma lanceolatum]